MNWDALGALGEIIGAAAVVLTLGYLAVQTRQARMASQETAKFASLETTRSMVSLYVEARKTLLAHSDLIAKANGSKELSGGERYALSIVFHDLFYGAAYAFRSAQMAGSLHGKDGDVEYFVSLIRGNDCAIAQWDRMKHSVAKMGPDFVPSVDAALVA